MNHEQIAGMAAAGESETPEFKSATGVRREAARTVCAMLNQNGGHVLFGVLPDGKVVRQHVSERTIEQLSAEFATIDPPAFPEIERIRVREALEVTMAISANRGQGRTVMYRGSAYRRVGNTTVEMHAFEHQQMLFERMHSECRWENQSADQLSVDDPDANEIRTTAEEAVRRGRLEDPGTRDPHDLLCGLGLFTDGILWRAAVVLSGNEESIRFDLPQCLLRVAHYDGIDPNRISRQPPVSGQRLLAPQECRTFPPRQPTILTT